MRSPFSDTPIDDIPAFYPAGTLRSPFTGTPIHLINEFVPKNTNVVPASTA